MLSEGVWNGVGVMRWILLRVKSGEKDFFYYTWSCNVWRTAVVRLVVERPRSVILSSCHCDNLKSTDSFTTIQKYEIMYVNAVVIYRSFPSQDSSKWFSFPVFFMDYFLPPPLI